MMRSFIAGGTVGLLLVICGIHITDWRFWVLLVGISVLRATEHVIDGAKS